ncbi:hypothetical protein Ancab_038144 [Ancistrocladus abbreviatus]
MNPSIFAKFAGNADLGPLKSGILDDGQAPGPAVDVHQKTLVLAGNRTRRPDILRGFKRYQGGWDFTNKHYWAAISVNYCGSSNASFCPSWSRYVDCGICQPLDLTNSCF